jgi:3-methyladenine DNA glycosylase AlkD
MDALLAEDVAGRRMALPSSNMRLSHPVPAGAMSEELSNILEEIRSSGDPRTVEGMARFGISATNTYGISMPRLRAMAKRIGRDHELAQGLWGSGVHEARIIAALIDDPALVTRAQLDRWVRDVDSWDVGDQLCLNLVHRTPFGYDMAVSWSRRSEEYVKRAGFALMAVLAVHDKNADDAAFVEMLVLIEAASDDERVMVKKAVNWALRQIGKRNDRLNAAALATAVRIRSRGGRAARWIAADAIRELQSDKVAARMRKVRKAL